MRLALQTDIALRALMYAATRNDRVTAAEVAAFYGISSAHVSKVVNQLARLGYVRSVRGVGGGIDLTQHPSEVSVGEIVSAFEGNMHLLDCVGMDGVCAIENFCKLKRVLSEAERIQVEYLESVSLADVLPSKSKMRSVSKDT